jgi:uncharacterized protein YkwD
MRTDYPPVTWARRGALVSLLGVLAAGPVLAQKGENPWADSNRYADEVFRLTNAARAAQGVPPLKRDPRLDRAAANFSKYMGEAGFTAHVGPDRVPPDQRITNQGYNWSWWAENIAWDHRTPHAAVNWWLNSPAHRANILDPNLKDLGVGVAIVNGRVYVTQDFGTPRASGKR